MFRVFLLSILVCALSLPVYAEELSVESHSLACAKWLMGSRYSSFENRAAAAKACVGGANVDCAKWVLGKSYNGYENRLQAVEACTPACPHHHEGDSE